MAIDWRRGMQRTYELVRVDDDWRERELVHVHRAVYDGEVNWSREELADGRFWMIDEIDANLGKGLFTPNFEQEYQKIKDRLLGSLEEKP